MVGPFPSPCSNRNQISQLILTAAAFQQIFRAGGGGGGDALQTRQLYLTELWELAVGGGGLEAMQEMQGVGSPTPSGAAATPATFNCVPVTPGGTAPITVGSPGGQIVISWNPQ
jgi:hypothetical protein